MAGISPHVAMTIPFAPAPPLRPSPRQLPPGAVASPAAAAPTRYPRRVFLRGFRHSDPLASNFLSFEDVISLQKKKQRQVLFASETDSPNTSTKQSSSSDDKSSSSDGPPVLTIVAGVVVFLLVFWAIGSFITWIVGLVLGAAKS